MTCAASASQLWVMKLIILELIGRFIIDIHDLSECHMIMCVYSSTVVYFSSTVVLLMYSYLFSFHFEETELLAGNPRARYTTCRGTRSSTHFERMWNQGRSF